MNIQQKIALSNRWDKIYFFTEGMFAQLYGVSLYLAVKEVGLSLKIRDQRYKILNNQLILKAGLPTNALENRCGNILIKRDFGYELNSNSVQEYDNYHKWYQAQLNKVLTSEQLTSNKKSPIHIEHNAVSERQVTEAPLGARLLLLSEQEYQFLKNWQMDKYPASTESGFIRGLHQKIACSGA